MRDRYTLVVGLLFAILILIAVINGPPGGGGNDTLGLDRQPPHWALPEFAVPLAIPEARRRRQRRPGRLRNRAGALPGGLPPHPGLPGPQSRLDPGLRPLRPPLAALVLVLERGGSCVTQQDVVDRVYARYRGRVAFLSVDVRDDRDTVRDLVREHGWRMPVGYDRDGAVAALYRVGLCPTFAYVYPGGTLQSASIGELTESQLSSRLDDLLRATRTAEESRVAQPGERAEMAEAEAIGAGPGWEPAPEQGWVAPHLAAEFPGLGVAWISVDGRQRKSPDGVHRRLRVLSDRFFGAQAIHLRERPIPWAYRVFFRQIGLDPDRTRTPVEQLALDRLHDGAFKSWGLPADALTIATVETGVALRAFDADRLEGRLCIRDSGPGEALAGRPGELAQGTLVIADERSPVGLLFGATAEGCEVGRETRHIAIVAVQVNGVPQISVDEALWIVAASIEGP